MPTIKITDTLNADVNVVNAKPNPLSSALDKYLTSPAVNILLLNDLMTALNRPLQNAGQTPVSRV